jgi:hypothetical protein
MASGGKRPFPPADIVDEKAVAPNVEKILKGEYSGLSLPDKKRELFVIHKKFQGNYKSAEKEKFEASEAKSRRNVRHAGLQSSGKPSSRLFFYFSVRRDFNGLRNIGYFLCRLV